jgi:hypothetical protein
LGVESAGGAGHAAVIEKKFKSSVRCHPHLQKKLQLPSVLAFSSYVLPWLDVALDRTSETGPSNQ